MVGDVRLTHSPPAHRRVAGVVIPPGPPQERARVIAAADRDELRFFVDGTGLHIHSKLSEGQCATMSQVWQAECSSRQSQEGGQEASSTASLSG